MNNHLLNTISKSLLLIVSTTSAYASPAFETLEGSASGIDFVHFNGMSGEYYFPEMMGGGVALFDYDGDGDEDLYLVQGAMLGPDKSAEDSLLPVPEQALIDRLYRNDGNLKFTDVTEQSGLRANGYGMGVTVGDIDNDGDPDLYLSNFGANQLWRNNGDGTFSDITAVAGVDDERWTVSSTFADYDGDGWLDLMVVNYVQYSFTNLKTCKAYSGAPDYCSPQSYKSTSDRLFRNQGDGTFVNVSNRVGIAAYEGPGLGVVARDFSGDGHMDFYVANDGAANFMWINDGNGSFTEQAMLWGVAVNMAGKPEASMGVDAIDYDHDGDEDLFMTHLDRQSNTLFVNQGTGWFVDRTVAMGLAGTSLPFTGFGVAWLDYDLDGQWDLFSANGAVVVIEQQRDAGDVYPLRQRNQLWRGTGDGFIEIGPDQVPALEHMAVSRGLALGDLDNDGDSDIVIGNSAGAPQLLINRAGDAQSWLGVDLRRDGVVAIGARVTIKDKTGKQRTQVVRRDGSYASALDPRLLFALEGMEPPYQLTVSERDKSVVIERQVDAVDRYHTIDIQRDK